MTTDMNKRMDAAAAKITDLHNKVPQVETMIRSTTNTSAFYGNSEERITHNVLNERYITHPLSLRVPPVVSV